MTNQSQPSPHARIQSAANWLTPRRIRAHAIVLAACLWGVCAVDYATPGLFDRAGNIKFQDFLPHYISAQLIARGHASELYNQQVTADALQAVVDHSDHAPTRVLLPNLYGPQVGLFFVPLARLSFPTAARIWVTASLLLFFACVYFVWKTCPALRPHSVTVALCAIAFPPLFHFFVRAQMSALVLACFTAAFLALRANRSRLAGIALGFLIFKPQFLVAIPLVLLLSRAWKPLAGLCHCRTYAVGLRTNLFRPSRHACLLRYALAPVTRDQRSRTQPCPYPNALPALLLDAPHLLPRRSPSLNSHSRSTF
jgi:hypothetical protein